MKHKKDLIILKEFNYSLRMILQSVIHQSLDYLDELSIGDAQIFDEYFMFFQNNGYERQSEFIHKLINYIRTSGNKSFEETYLLTESAKELVLFIDKGK